MACLLASMAMESGSATEAVYFPIASWFIEPCNEKFEKNGKVKFVLFN